MTQPTSSAPQSSSAVRVGHVIAGKFRVERALGEGGMGYVVLATHLMLDERVALKFLRKEVMLQPDVVARFLQEARAAAKLKSEHVARVLDVGVDDAMPYIVMEYLEGRNLEEILAARGPLPVNEAVELVVQAAEGISEAHARGIIHRDIKPANLFLAERADGWPTLKILDFGISKAALTSTNGLAIELSKQIKTLQLLGSPYYMSPEQIRSTKDVDRRTDIWALGVVLFELLTGQTAWTSTDLLPLAQEIGERPHRKLSAFLTNAPEGLEALIDRALAKNPKDRFQSAAEMSNALLAFTASKRSRVIATHAATLTRSSGIDPDLPLPSMAPAALSSSGTPIAIPLGSSGSLPKFDSNSSGSLPAASPASSKPQISPTDPTINAAPVALAPAPQKAKTSGTTIGFAAVVVVGIAATIAFLTRSVPPTTSNQPARVEPTASAAPPRPTETASAAPVVSAVASAAVEADAGAAAATDTVKPKPQPQPVKHVPSAQTAVPTRDLDIRLER
jgi:serine/threonine protein kinase